jgi:hypothetical protein
MQLAILKNCCFDKQGLSELLKKVQLAGISSSMRNDRVKEEIFDGR